MNLDIYLEDKLLQVEVPPEILEDATDFYAMMDRDMDKGWKIGPAYVEQPSSVQRAQIAADKLLTAIETENERLLRLMAGYILNKVPGVTGVRLATSGDPQETELLMG